MNANITFSLGLNTEIQVCGNLLRKPQYITVKFVNVLRHINYYQGVPVLSTMNFPCTWGSLTPIPTGI